MDDLQAASAGVVTALPDPAARPRRSAPGPDEPRGLILLFTGVRYERPEPNPRPSSPAASDRRRRRR